MKSAQRIQSRARMSLCCMPGQLWSLLVLVLLILPLAVRAQTVPPPSEAALAEVTRRGRFLAAYDVAAWHATDAMTAKWPNPTGVEGFLAQQTRLGSWQVLFGRLSAHEDSLIIMVTADELARPEIFSATIHTTPRIGTDVERRAFRAMRKALTHLGASQRPYSGPYNSYVMPGDNGGWYVYFLPAQTQAGVYPHGGDFRYDMSPDGATIVSKFQMHNTVFMSHPTQLRQGKDSLVALGHTVVTADRPQDSDVFLVLSREPHLPEMIATDHFDYEIHVDGTITWKYGKRNDEMTSANLRTLR